MRLQDDKNETITGRPRAVCIVGSQVADRMRGRSIRRHHLLVLCTLALAGCGAALVDGKRHKVR